ncbi:MAG: Methyl-accepting chemotaxis protein I (serine chemoreceptor protein) [uncultured Paraburkholderia sp.]|nr:MAG: Methyl-accepting chemotaxis protein I (serine chemoreceptor protein) [uncultured Paraburkholderia sp.]CAH2941421.1 MAG: Methyl-accepting chemotaxis protein I (serine chemoreceptor protein) [uncultured Paraburkholderia sp.]
MSRISSLKAKLYVLICLISLTFLAASVWSAVQMRNLLIAGHATELQHLTESIHSILVAEQTKVASSEQTEAQAQATVKAQIATLRYGADGYFFVLTDGPVLLSHVNPALIGKNVGDFRSTDGKPIYQDLLTLARRNGQDTYDYAFPRPGTSVAERKLSYYLYDPQWNWVIVTGVYLADVDEAFRDALVKQMALTAVIVLVLLIAIRMAAQRMVFTPVGNTIAACEASHSVRRSRQRKSAILIKTSGERVLAGMELVGEAGCTMKNLAAAIQRVTDIMGEIAAVSAEQSSGIEQVNLAIAQMDEVT